MSSLLLELTFVTMADIYLVDYRVSLFNHMHLSSYNFKIVHRLKKVEFNAMKVAETFVVLIFQSNL